MSMRTYALAAVLVVLAVLAWGCSQPQSAPQPAAPKPSTGTPKYGGTLRYWIASAPGGFDLHRRPGQGPVFGNLVFNNLVRFDVNKRNIGPDTLVGDLAERWETSGDGKTITFFLRKDVKWHDGKQFTAADVVYTLKKLVDPKQSVMASSLPSFDRAEKTDDYTVKVYLKYPSPGFLVQMAGAYMPVEPEHKASVDWRTTDFLVGTGPFKFKSATTGVSYDLVKNPDYFKKGVPYLDGVNVSVITDRSAQVDAFATGRVDMTAVTAGVANQEQMDRFKSQIPNAVINPQLSNQASLYWFNVKKGALSDVRVRRALALLIDPVTEVTAAYGNKDWADYDHAIMPGKYGIPRAEFDKMLGRDKPMEARITEAKALLSQAGFASGLKIKAATMSTPEYARRLTATTDLWRRALNIQVDQSALEPNDYRTRREAGEFEVSSDATTNFLGEPDDMLSNYVTGGSANYTGWGNARADQLWQEQSRTTDVVKRRQLTGEIERIILTEFPAVPIFWGLLYTAWQPYVKGFTPQETWYTTYTAMEYVWLDK